MVKQQRSIEEFGRIRLGKPEVVTEHTRTYDVKPKLDKKTEDKIKQGKAKRLIEKKETIGKYFLRNRPIMLGTVPNVNESITHEDWIPSKENNFRFGYIEYPNKLSFEDIWKYELEPSDPIEKAHYTFWEKEDKDPIKAEKLKKRYLSMSKEELEKYIDRDPFCRSALILKEEQSKARGFIDSFKDQSKKKKKSGQTNLDKQLDINTKLLDEYGDLKSFDKHQKRFDKITPNETKEIIFNGEKYIVLASTWEEAILPITEEDKKESDKWMKENPNAKSTNYRFNEYNPYIQDKILKKEQKKKEKPKQEKFGSKKIDTWTEEDYETFRNTPTYQERMGETKEYFIKRIKQEQKRNPELLESLEAKDLEAKSKDELLFMLIQREVAIYNELAKIPLNIKKEKKPKQEKKKPKTDLETLSPKEAYIKYMMKSYTKKQLYDNAKAQKIKGISKMQKDQLARTIITKERIDYEKETPIPNSEKEFYTNRLECKKLWRKHYNEETGEGTDKYIKACEEYFKKKETKKEKMPITEKKDNSKLKPLETGEKYFIIEMENDYPRYLTYTTKKDKALEYLEKNKGIEIIPAKNMNHVRDQIYARGKKDYLITGETYKNKGEIREIARVKFDYGKKGYCGKLSPEQVEKLKQIEGLEIIESKELTTEDKEESKRAKAHSKSRKYIRHTRKEGSIWQKENPFTDEQNELDYSLNWIFRMGPDSKNRLNSKFRDYMNSKENDIKRRLRLKNIEDAPDDVQNALDRYRKEVYNKILSDLSANQKAPSMAITGSSKYKGNFDKRESIEKNAYERYKKVDKAVDKVVGQYVNLKHTKTAEERRQEKRKLWIPKLKKAQEEGKKVNHFGNWYEIKRVNQKTVTVNSKTMGDFRIEITLLDGIEK